MAEIALQRIKEAEDQVAEMIRTATENARSALAQAKKQGSSEYEAIMQQAQEQRAQLIQSAKEKALDDYKESERICAQERSRILAPDAEKFEAAVRLVMERVVDLDGNR